MKLKQVIKSFFRTLFFRGNYQFLPTVIAFWYYVLTYPLYVSSNSVMSGNPAWYYVLTYPLYVPYDPGIFSNPVWYGILAFGDAVMVLGVFVANLVGIILFKWLYRWFHVGNR